MISISFIPNTVCSIFFSSILIKLQPFLCTWIFIFKFCITDLAHPHKIIAVIVFCSVPFHSSPFLRTFFPIFFLRIFFFINGERNTRPSISPTSVSLCLCLSVSVFLSFVRSFVFSWKPQVALADLDGQFWFCVYRNHCGVFTEFYLVFLVALSWLRMFV